MNKKTDWYSVDTSDWGTVPDTQIAARFNVHKSVIAYWREKFGIPSYKDYLKAERDEKFSQGLHWCAGCESYKPVSLFGKSSKNTYGLRVNCLECRRQNREVNAKKRNVRKRAYYQENREYLKKKNENWREQNREYIRDYMAQRVRALKIKYVGMSGGCCQRCRYSEFISALEFHHVDPTQKDEAPVSAINSGDEKRAINELDKCCLLCRNCHMALHASEWVGAFVKRRGLGWTVK